MRVLHQKASIALSPPSRYMCLPSSWGSKSSNTLGAPWSLISILGDGGPSILCDISGVSSGAWVLNATSGSNFCSWNPLPPSVSHLWSGCTFSAVHDPVLGILSIPSMSKAGDFYWSLGFVKSGEQLQMQNSTENNLKWDNLCLKFLWPFSLPTWLSPIPTLCSAPLLGPLSSTCSHLLHWFSNSWSPHSV